MSTDLPLPSFRLRSFVRRNGRLTRAQAAAYQQLSPQLMLDVTQGLIDATTFGRHAPTFLEIGFGSGQSLLALAKAEPLHNFIGVETHKPGIGALFHGIAAAALTNLRVYDADAVDVLQTCIPDNYLDGLQLFFPDPWQKRRHHLRRLIQTDFVLLMVSKLKYRGTLHLATDWQDYATHMLHVLAANPSLINMAPSQPFATRSPYRPILTKFERRAVQAGRPIWELQYQRREE